MARKFFTRYLSFIISIFALLLAAPWAYAVGGGDGGDDPVEEYAEAGSFSTVRQSGGSSCTIFRPAQLSGDRPIILWGNGTGNSPSDYEEGLEHWASWGFVVAAANTSNAGTGTAMLSCLTWLQNSNLASSLDFGNVGASGHSQGGGGAIMAGRDNRVSATVPFMPYTVGLGHNSASQRQQSGPMLLVSGGSDFIASRSTNQAPVFQRANVDVFWATLEGAGHSVEIDFSDYRGMSTAWFLYTLGQDNSLGSLFEGSNCEVCDEDGWIIEQKGL